MTEYAAVDSGVHKNKLVQLQISVSYGDGVIHLLVVLFLREHICARRAEKCRAGDLDGKREQRKEAKDSRNYLYPCLFFKCFLSL